MRHSSWCVLLLCLLTAAAPAAQSPAPCGDDCAASPDHLVAAAAQIDRDRTAFVSALRQLTQQLPGAYGDEGHLITASVEEMARALARWDRSLATSRGLILDAAWQTPDGHLALAGAYLERGRASDALKEAAAAAARDPARPQTSVAEGLAYDLLQRHADAAVAYERAAHTPGAGATLGAAYGRVQQLIAAGNEAGAAAALRTFDTLAAASAQVTAPFLRVGLLRQPAGVSVIFPPARYARGFALIERGKLDEGVRELRSAAAADPMTAPDVRDDRDRRLGSEALRRGDAHAAIEHFTAAANRLSDRSETHRMLGLALEFAQQHDRSIEELTAARARNRSDDRAASALAEILLSLNRAAQAERVLREELGDVPDSGIARYQLATLVGAAGRTSEAIAETERASAAGPIIGQDYLYDTLGTLYISDANLAGALDAYRRRVLVNPNHSDAHRKLGQIYLELGRADEAAAEFAAALLLDPANAEAHAGRAQVSFRRGEYEAAEHSARRALSLNQAHPAAQYALGASLLRLGRTAEGTEALDVFRRLQDAAQEAADRAWELKLRTQSAQTGR